MPMLSPKRQVAIPKELCDRLHVRPGDEIDFVEHGRPRHAQKNKQQKPESYLKADALF